MTQSKPTRAFHLPSLRGGRGPSQGRDLFLELNSGAIGEDIGAGGRFEREPV